jgi:SagB-type dehydrogenase family enzyme
MNPLTKMALGLIGQLTPAPAAGYAESTLALPAPQTTEGVPLMQALRLRQSQRSFDPSPLPMQTLSNLLWAAAGVNRVDLKGRTAPSAMNAQEVDVYAALPGGLYQYEPVHHRLLLTRDTDVRRVTGYQDFVDTAPLDLVYVAHHGRMSLVPAAQRDAYAWCAAGAMAQNASLYCASAGLATVIRAWIARDALAQAMGLTSDEQVLVAQTVGFPKGEPPA